MRIKLSKFLEQLCVAASQGSRAGIVESVKMSEKADELDVEIPIAGEKLRVEGASNLPPTILRTKTLRATTQGLLELDDEGDVVVTMKKQLIRTAPELTVEIEFERSDPLQSMEQARDVANEVNKQRHQVELVRNLNAKMKKE